MTAETDTAVRAEYAPVADALFAAGYSLAESRWVGVPVLDVFLPDGREVGQVHARAGDEEPDEDARRSAFTAWTSEHLPRNGGNQPVDGVRFFDGPLSPAAIVNVTAEVAAKVQAASAEVSR